MSTSRCVACLRALRFTVSFYAALVGLAGCSAEDAGEEDNSEPTESIQQALCTPGSTCPSGFTCCGNVCCTSTQCCNGSTCVSGSSVSQCGSFGSCRNCDDINPCTTDSCSSGSCGHAPADGTCTGGECIGNTCCTGCEDAAGACVPLASQSVTQCGKGAADCAACNDNNPCTVDRCLNGVCDFSQPAATTTVCRASKGQCDRAETCGGALTCPADSAQPNGTVCTDNNACTQDDTCQSGACRPGTALNCNDSNTCTDDSCNAATGCVNARRPDNVTCDDGNACTVNDRCAAGRCTGTGNNCDDDNPCTTDACDPSTQLCTPVNVANNTPCSDNNQCTTEDKCQNGRCVAGGPLDCTDTDPCTTNSCEPATGCRAVANDGGACGDAGAPDGGDSGASGSGGGGGSAGASGAGGTNNGGASGSTFNDASADGSSDIGYFERELQGCSCKVPQTSRGVGPGSLSALILLVAFRLRRRAASG